MNESRNSRKGASSADIWAHMMYEEQLKLKADSHQSRLAKKSASPTLAPYTKMRQLTLNAFRPA